MDLLLPKFARTALRPLAHRGVIPPRCWWRLSVQGEFTVRLPEGRFRYVSDPSDIIGRSLFWNGLDAWEWIVLREFVPRAKSARGFLDIGANTGVYTLLGTAVNPGLNAIAFEPAPEPLARLQHHVDINALRNRVQVQPVAVSDRTGTSRFFVPDGKADMSFLEGAQTPSVPGRWVDVPTISARHAVPAGFPVDLVKIDVENAEGQVIESLQPILHLHRPTLIVEMLPEGSHEQARRVLAALDYRIGRITVDGLDWDSSEPLAGDGNNFLCEPIS